MPSTSILEQLRKLIELQKIDADVFEFKRQLKEKPIILNEFKVRFENQSARLKQLEEQLKTSQVQRKNQELELQTKEQEILKANNQLFQIKTNKEYTAKMSEIEGMKADKSLVEEKILISYDEGDQLAALIEQEKKFLLEEEKKYLSQKKTIDDDTVEIQQKINALEAQRNRIIPEIEKNTLARYEKILNNKDGLALVPIIKNSCGGCYMNVPAQLINDIKKHESIIQCEVCARLLYLQEDFAQQ